MAFRLSVFSGQTWLSVDITVKNQGLSGETSVLTDKRLVNFSIGTGGDALVEIRYMLRQR